MEALVRAFDQVMQTAVIRSEEKLKMALAIGDEETAVQERIRLSTIKITWEMFVQCQTEVPCGQESFFHDLYTV